MGRVQGKVAFITGAGRGQGRSHAVRLAEEGADIIAVDRCEDFATVGYPMATPEDLEETAHFVEKTGQRIVTAKVDVADGGGLKSALEAGIAELGRLDIVVTAAGIAGMKGSADLPAWIDVMNTNLIGTINAIHAALPHLSDGASIIATGSTAALMDVAKNDNRAPTPAVPPTCTRKGCCRNTCTISRPSSHRGASGPTWCTRRIPTRRCCRVHRCTNPSGQTWMIRRRPTPNRCSTYSRR
jgi:NAD(P)-dependent dehydrogenase (short-subunit alcohol dehydrogenase family)